MVLLSGILSTHEFTDKTWSSIQKFIDDKRIKINSENNIDEFIKKLK